MSGHIHRAIADFLRTSHTCHLFVHRESRSLEDTAAGLASDYGWPCLAVGRELGDALLAEPPQRRSRAARRWISARLGEMAPSPVLCTGIDLLFEPALSLDPLRLFRDAGRTTRLVVAWPGTYRDDILAYAVPDHSHYRTWRKPTVHITTLT